MQVSMILESAAVMGWFVILVLGEKYLDDATRSRRGAEDRAEEMTVLTAMSGECTGIQTGTPDVSSFVVPLASGLGINVPTLPNYVRPFVAAATTKLGDRVQAAPPLDFTSGTFRARRTEACLEPSLDSPGAPWSLLGRARDQLFVRHIMGYF
jgi:hypothetical protein